MFEHLLLLYILFHFYCGLGAIVVHYYRNTIVDHPFTRDRIVKQSLKYGPIYLIIIFCTETI